MKINAFLARWTESGASERANKDLFLSELCDVLDLERLVALNAQRAEEEKRGLVRWLRPDYQQKVVKVKGVAAEPSPQPSPGGRGSRTGAARRPDKSSKPPWPKALPDQITAVRNLVLGSGRAWSGKEVARGFHRAQVKTVEPVLDSLAAIGLLVSLDGDNGKQWKGAGE